MWYAKARYYNPDLGRFAAEDPVKGNILDIQSLNLYPYVKNNPLKYVDPDGRIPVIDEYGSKGVNNKPDYLGEDLIGIEGTGKIDFVVGKNGIVESVSNGQHVLQRHVGKTDAQLLQRLKSNPKITGVSTFTDDIIADKVINATLNEQANINKINKWLSNGAKGNLPLYYKGNTIIGRGIKQGSTTAKNMTNAKVILKSNGQGGYDILTAYPY